MTTTKPYNLLVLGGNSDIVFAILRNLEPTSIRSLTLVSRDKKELDRRANDVGARLNISVDTIALDLTDAEHTVSFCNCTAPPDIVLLGQGALLDTSDLRDSPDELSTLLRINYESFVISLEALVPRMSDNGGGHIIVLNSVAGLRARSSNFVYGSTKAGLAAYLQGLRLNWFDRQIKVTNVYCGMVSTKMTADRKINRLLLTQPEVVAKTITRAFWSQRQELYAPSYWRWIMLMVRMMPDILIRKLNF